MAWLFLIVVCGISALVKLDAYVHKIAFTKFRITSKKQIRRQIFNVCVKNFKNLRKRLWASSKRNPTIVLLVIAWGFIGFSVWRFSPDLYKLYKELAGQILEGEKTAEEYRGIAIRYFGIIAGAGAVIGYIFATGRNIILDNQNKINAQAQTTESMVQAITQIGAVNDGKPNIEVRLGGLYSLQRIMQKSPEDEFTILKIFYAYVRENLKRDRTKQPKQRGLYGYESYKLPEDIQAVLNIISQFNREQREQGKNSHHNNQLSLSNTDFSGYSLVKMDFSHAILENADFSDTDLSGAQLCDTNLYCANLSGADAHGVNLCRAMLFSANLSGANLFSSFTGGAILTGVDFSNTDLSGTSFRNENFASVNLFNTDLENTSLHGADLSESGNLTQEQLNQSWGDEKTKLPKGLNYPESWKSEPKMMTTKMKKQYYKKA